MFKKIAQEAPLAPPAPAPEAAPAAPPIDLGIPAGLPDLGSMGLPAPAPAPSAPMASPAGGERQEILSPIESVSQIFYDMDVVNFVENNLHINANELTRKIWLDYGGKENGKSDQTKVGQRTEDVADIEPDQAKKEREQTEDSKWERLKSGKTIEDIISYADLGKMVEGIIFGVVQKAFAAGQTPPAGAGGGMPSFASNKARIIIAKNLEREYLFKQSDTMIKEIINKINLH
jgi:hypothetical protein